MAAAARGCAVELVGRTGDDPQGDALLLALGRVGVGHAALLRDPTHATPVTVAPVVRDDALAVEDDDEVTATITAGGPPLQPADVALGLRYLTTFAVLVVTDDVPADALPVAVEAAAFAGAHLVVLVASGEIPPGDLPASATVLAAPDGTDDGEFGALVGAYAAALDQGADPADAFRSATGDAGWEAAV